MRAGKHRLRSLHFRYAVCSAISAKKVKARYSEAIRIRRADLVAQIRDADASTVHSGLGVEQLLEFFRLQAGAQRKRSGVVSEEAVLPNRAQHSGGTRHLVAVLANPPSVTSGDRTIRRVALAAQLLGCESFSIANLFPEASPDVTGIEHLGRQGYAWEQGREQLREQLIRATDVLLGWGCTEPAGQARIHHRAQVHWLLAHTSRSGASLWWVGGQPRHPSRWQRRTSRAYPHLEFSSALAHVLEPFVARSGDDQKL